MSEQKQLWPVAIDVSQAISAVTRSAVNPILAEQFGDGHLFPLNAFRDDAHPAAWQPYDINGRSWEAFTLVWRGEAQTAEELAETE